MKLTSTLLLIGFICSAHSLRAQGRMDYVNVESPQTKPITVATIEGHDYILACNTPDSSVEIWDTDETITPVEDRFIARIPVGTEPVSIKFYEPLQCFYTANYLGDSITKVHLFRTPGAPARELQYEFDRTNFVGDSPMDVGFYEYMDPLTEIMVHLLFVPMRERNSVLWFNAEDLLPALPPFYDFPLWDSVSNPDKTIKAPHRVEIRNDRVYILGLQGGGFPNSNFPFDNDIWIADFVLNPIKTIDGLGTNNLGMAFDSDGLLFVVGQEGQNDHPDVVAMLDAEKTGFVQSTLYCVVDIDGQHSILRRNLNALNDQERAAVEFEDALAQPTDIVVFEPTNGTKKLFLTAMGSDRVAVVEPDLADPYQWPLRRIDISPQPGFRLAGPRGLAVKYANSLQTTDPGDRIYCLSRLDNAVTIIDPNGVPQEKTVGRFKLKGDPRPEAITAGQSFLYDARLSGNGFVSCASCHIDGRLDQGVWFLGDPSATNETYPFELTGGINSMIEWDRLQVLIAGGFPSDKGPMMTQSLQGLLNYEVDPEFQEFFTNAPYHWRADRDTFVAFLEAFETDGLLEGGKVTMEEMELFEEFINTIHYPPNPKQPGNRRYSGELGDPNSNTDGTDGLLGMKLFHIEPLISAANRSCVQCHALPEGSNNLITEIFEGATSAGSMLETAAMRGLRQKNAFDEQTNLLGTIKSGNFGILHPGNFPTVNKFIEDTFFLTFGGPNSEMNLAVKQFFHEFDWHMAPLAGPSYTVDLMNLEDDYTTLILDDVEEQVELANIGLVAHHWSGDRVAGYWFRVDGQAREYQLEGATNEPPMTRAQLLAKVTSPQDRIVFTGTPLGSDRRIAAINGVSSPMSGPAPLATELIGMAPNTAFEEVPKMEKNWDPFHVDPNLAFHFVGASPTAPFVKAVRLFQRALLEPGIPDWGLDKLRHEAPRRFRVAGRNILPGAKLQIFVPDDGSTPPNPQGTLEQSTTRMIELPLYQTGDLHNDLLPIWTTAAELDPFNIYMMMLGGPKAPGIETATHDFDDRIDELNLNGMFDPVNWNWHYIRVINPDGNSHDAGWSRITLAP